MTTDVTTGTPKTSVFRRFRYALVMASCAAGAALGALIVGPPPAAHAESAATTINLLEASGFDVRISRVGSAPLSECVVTNVGQPIERRVFVDHHDHGPFDRVIVRRSVSVAVDCSR
jgi:hypothetical protein